MFVGLADSPHLTTGVATGLQLQRLFCRQWMDVSDYSLSHSSSLSESRCRAEFYRVDLGFGPCDLVEPFYLIVLGHAEFFRAVLRNLMFGSHCRAGEEVISVDVIKRIN